MTRVLRAASTNIIGDDRKAVDFEDAFDLHEQAVKKAEVAARDAGNRSDCLCIGDVGFVERETELAPKPGQNEGEFIALQGPVVMGKADAAVKLRVAGQPFFHARHSDQNDADASAVKYVSDEFERGHRQAFCFIDDQHFDVKLVARYDPVFHMPVMMIVNAGVHAVDVFAESFLQIAQRAKYGRPVKDGA
ncbi:MAG: hypothetical protein WB676_26040 [Bryobacteraceae bacterium]